MEKIQTNGLTLFFDSSEQEAAGLVRDAAEQSIHILQEQWDLAPPDDCRLYVMTSWSHFMFHAAPWPWKVLLAITLPLWAFRARKVWAVAGGWNQRFGKRQATGVKPPWLMQKAVDKSQGRQIFVEQNDIREKVRQVTCHELTHAFTDHLRLPVWLHEGLAMVTVDRFAGGPTVRFDTLAWATHAPGIAPRLRELDIESLVQGYARSYWVTRYIAETRAGLLKDLLRQRYPHSELEGRLAEACGLSNDGFSRLGELAVSYFEQVGSA